MDEPRIDLSALDVHADELRFERTGRRVTDAVRQPRANSLLANLARHGRLTLAAAAALALAAWMPALLTGGDGHQTSQDPVLLVAEWAQVGAIPADASVFSFTGSTDVR